MKSPRAVLTCFHTSHQTQTDLSTCTSQLCFSHTRPNLHIYPSTCPPNMVLTREIHALSFKTKTLPLTFSITLLPSILFLLLAFHFQTLPSLMASNDLKHRVTPHPDSAAATNTVNDKSRGGSGNRREKRMVMAKRGLRSLAIAVSLPLSLTILSAFIGSSVLGHSRAQESKKPFWFPPSWALHLTCPASSFLMGLSAWMVWVDGGFHRNPTALLLYMTQLLLTVLWDPIVFGVGATRVGLMVCFGLFLSQLGCMRVFRPVNPIAGDLIKPCLAWIAFLFIVNLKLLFV